MTTYYVDATSGSDSALGTSEGEAWKTIAKVNASSFSAGDSVLFKKGEVWRERLTVSWDGSVGNVITFGAYGTGVNPIFKGSLLTSSWSNHTGNIWRITLTTSPNQVFFDDTRGTKVTTVSEVNSVRKWYWNSNVLYVYASSDPNTLYVSPGIEASIYPSTRNAGVVHLVGRSYVTVQDIDALQSNSFGIYIQPSSSNIIVDGCRAAWSIDGGIVVSGTGNGSHSQDITLTNCESEYNNTPYADGGTPGIDTYHEGVTMAGTDGFLIDGCEVHDNYMEGVNFKDGSTNGIIQRCLLHDNALINQYVEGASNITIRYNRLYDCTYNAALHFGIEQNTYNNDTITVHHNLFYGNNDDISFWALGGATAQSQNITIEHNDFYGCLNACLRWKSGATDNLGGTNYFRNNILWGTYGIQDETTGDEGLGCTTISYNAFKSGMTTDSNGTNSVTLTSTPFTDAVLFDFTLVSGSPCIDAATDLGYTVDFRQYAVPADAGPDIGAYEYNSAASEESGLPDPPVDPPEPDSEGNDFSRAAGCVAVYNFESITAGASIVCSASSEYSASYAAWKAFEKGSTPWQTTVAGAAPCWVTINFGSGREVLLTAYSVIGYSVPASSPKDWIFEGYNGVSWQTLDTQSSQTGWTISESRTFSLSGTTAYQGYRLSISANNGGATTYIYELRLWNGTAQVYLDMPANALLTGTVLDSKGSNDLIAVGTASLPVLDTVDFKEGASSLDLEANNFNCLYRPDHQLSSGWPFKKGTTNYSCSTTQWVQFESTASYYYYIWSKGTDAFVPGQGHRLYVFENDLYYYCMDNIGADYREEAYNVIQTGRWYFIATVWDNAAKIIRLYVWDDVLGAVVADNSDNWSAANDSECEGGDWIVGGHAANDTVTARVLDGKIDEHTVWNRALTTAEIELIRQGLYYTPYSVPPAIFFSQKGYEETLIYKSAFWTPKYPAIETLTWKTDIIKPKDSSKEQRIALRTIPRQSFRYNYSIPANSQRTIIENYIFNNLKKKWGVPVWHEHVHHSGTLNAGATSISIDTQYADFRNNSYAMLWKSETEMEVLHIATKTDNALNLSIELQNTYIGDKLIIPMRFGYITVPPRRIRRHNQGEQDLLEVEFSIVDNATVSGHSASQTYDNLEVVLRPHLKSQELSDSFDGDFIIEDNETGEVSLTSYSEFNITNQIHCFRLEDKQDMWEFRQWLHSVYGPQKAFLIPTYLEDMILTRTLAAGSTSVYVANTGLARYMGLNTMRTYLAFEKTDGTLLARKITNITEVSTTEELITIDISPGVQFASDTPVMFLDRCRLGYDTIEIEHNEDGDSICNTMLTRIEQ